MFVFALWIPLTNVFIQHHLLLIFLQASLTYGEAQMIIDDPERKDDIALSLRGLNKLAKILKQKRIDKG